LDEVVKRNMSYQPSFCESSLEALGDTKSVSFTNQLFTGKKERKACKVSPLPSSSRQMSLRQMSMKQRLQGVVFSELVESLNELVVLGLCVVTTVDYCLAEFWRDYMVAVMTLWLLLIVLTLLREAAQVTIIGFHLLASPWHCLDLCLSLILAVALIVCLSLQDSLWKYDIWVAGVRALCLFLCFRKVKEMKKVLGWMCRTASKQDLSVGTAADKVQEVLQTLLDKPWLRLDSSLYSDLQWCIEKVTSNTLHQPLLLHPSSSPPANEQEVLDLVNQYSRYGSPATIHMAKKPGTPTAFDGKAEIVTSEMTEEVKQCFREVDTCEFDIFRLKVATKNNELFALVQLLFRREELMDELSLDTRRFTLYISRIQSGYNVELPYHNATHAADVTQTLHYFLTTCEGTRTLGLAPVDVAAAYLSAAVHDFEHPGLTNGFLVATQAELAIRYNDRSVLENHHISAAFALALDESCDIFADLQAEYFSRMRELMIMMVLATDSINHFPLLSQFKASVDSGTLSKPETIPHVLSVLLHACDISNPTKPWQLCERWADLVLTEFWQQGDRERQLGLPLSFLADRFSVNTAKSQTGFIDVMVLPLFETMKRALPEVEVNCRYLIENRRKWVEMDQSRKSAG